MSNAGQCLKILEQRWRDVGALKTNSQKLLDHRGLVPRETFESYEMSPTPTGRARARSARARALPRLKPLAGLRLGTPAPTQSYRLGVLLCGLRSMRSHCSTPLGPARQHVFRKIRYSGLGLPPGAHFGAISEPFWIDFRAMFKPFCRVCLAIWVSL